MNTMSKLFNTLLGGGLGLLLSLVAISPAGAQSCVQPPAGMVSWWPGDGNANDIHDSNHGTLQGGATFAAGMVGQAFSFDGVDDAVRIADTPSLRLSRFTVDAWVRFDVLPDVTKIIISKGVVGPLTSDDAGRNFNYGIFLLADRRISAGFEEQDGTNHFASSINQLALGVFYHIAVTYNGTTVDLYINGVREGQHAPSAAPDLSTVDVMIGNAVKDTGHNPNDVWQGLIDEVEFYNRALSADEIGAIFDAGSAGKCKFPIEELTSLSPATLWIGLKNSDDQGTQFDLRTEVYINDTPVAEGETRCITGVTRNPSKAKEASVEFGPISEGVLVSGDVLSLRVLTRIGTNPNSTKCSGPGGSHNNAVGLRLYYDAVSRPSRFDAEITPDPIMHFFLHSIGADFFFDATPPTATPAKFKDSSAINFTGGNPWKEIGTWDMTIP